MRQDDGTLIVERPDDERENRALHGLTRSLVNNMVVGVTDGFRKELEIVGVGYRAEAQGPARCGWPSGSATRSTSRRPTASPSRCRCRRRSSSAASTRKSSARSPPTSASIRKPEPYKGKGVRYPGEQVLRKAGKAGKK